MLVYDEPREPESKPVLFVAKTLKYLKVPITIRRIFWGMVYKYPLCCIKAFLRDDLAYLQRREQLGWPDQGYAIDPTTDGYVPCIACGLRRGLITTPRRHNGMYVKR